LLDKEDQGGTKYRNFSNDIPVDTADISGDIHVYHRQHRSENIKSRKMAKTSRYKPGISRIFRNCVTYTKGRY